ncbi:hypothetical protein HW537_13840 [Asaia siamensis]
MRLSRLPLLATAVMTACLLPVEAAQAAGSPEAVQAEREQTGRIHFFDSDTLGTDERGRPTLAVSDSRGIFDALEKGDTARLLQIRHTLEKAPGPEPAFNVMLFALCDAATARTMGDLPRADHIIHEALRQAAPWSNPAHSVNPFNLMLATFLTGNLLLENQWLPWAGGRHFIDQAFRTPLATYYGKTHLILTDLDQISLTVPVSEILPVQVSGPPVDQVAFNPFQTLVDGITTATAGTIIDLDGSEVHAVINTGSVLGAVPQTLQRKHHWPVIGTLSPLRNDTIQSEKNDLVQVPSLTLGHTVFRNQIMLVANINHTIIGLQSLGMLPHIVMTDHGMSFGPDAPFSCTRRAMLESQIDGLQASLLLPVSYGGQHRMAALVTGDNSPEPLVIERRSLTSLHGIETSQEFETGTGMVHENAILNRTNLRLDKHAVQARIRYRVGDPAKPPILSMSALESASLSIDLHQGVACLD